MTVLAQTIIYPPVVGEIFVKNTFYPPGDSRRYGIVPGDGIDHESNGDNEKLKYNSNLALVQGFFASGFHKYGLNMKAVYSGYKHIVQTGNSFGNIYHAIGGGTQATATATNVGNGVGPVTMVVNGTGYFTPPFCTAYNGSGIIVSQGVTLTPTLGLNTMELLISGGSGYGVADTITVGGGGILNVASVTAGGVVATVTLNSAGSYADPRNNVGDGNVFSQTATSGVGVGFKALLSFSILSIATTAAGSGLNGSTPAVLIEPPILENFTIEGQIVSYGRLLAKGLSTVLLIA